MHEATPDATPAQPLLDADNPLAAPSPLPYALPPFDRITEGHLRQALVAGMAEERAELEDLLSSPDEPTFANTLEALERSGRLLARAVQVFANLTGTDSTEGLRALEEEMAPLLSTHRDSILLDPRLFARVEALHARRDGLGLDPEQRRLLERYRTDLVRAGAALPADRQERLRALNAELSTLTTTFQSRLLAATNAAAVHVRDRAELDGLGEERIAAAAEAARARNLDGYLLTLVLPTAQPVLASLHDRDLRRRLHTASVTRGALGDENDTRDVVVRVVALRAERAGLLGYDDHASYVVEDETAGSVAAVTDMLARLVGPAIANARAEQAELTELLHADGHDGELQPWDWAYYAERLRRDRFAVDAAAMRPYFELDRVVRDGVFAAATALYGVTFTERDDLPRYHPDVRVYEVADADGSPLGLFLADWFARDAKRGGAWMSTFVDQSTLLGTQAVVTVNLNVPKPPPGEPVLLTTDEVRTAFHEFGHALHGLFSDVRYPRFSGTEVPRDFVEYPSQVNEMWAWRPEVLGAYAVHHRTGEPLPADDVERLLAAQRYGEGFATTEYLGAALLDLEWHRLRPRGADLAPQDVEAFERAALERHGIALDAVPPRYRTSYFLHVFGGGYAAGYYSYIWSEVLDADTVEWFSEAGGLRRENGDTFRRRLLSRGGSVDPMEAFEAVRGRPPRIEPLLARRGLDAAAGAGALIHPEP